MKKFEYNPQKGLLLLRYGHLAPVKQNNKKAPEKKGLWAFISPYWDWWFLSGTFSRDKFDKEGKVRKELFHKFWAKGPIYTRLQVPGGIDCDDWCLTDTANLAKYLPKAYARDVKLQMQIMSEPDMPVIPRERPDNIAEDSYEVFVPRKAKIS